MAQHDLDIANGAGNVVRADINGALVALGTQQSGGTAPTGPSAGWVWLDTNTPSSTVWTESVYDGTDWIVRGRVDTTNNRYSAAGAPLWGSTAGGTANALTVTNNVAPPARFPGQRFTFIVATTNTGAATLNDNAIGAAAIVRPDGGALLARDLISGHMVEVVWDGTSWRLTDWPDPLVLLSRATASATAQIVFTLPSDYTDFVLEYSAVRPSVDGGQLVMQTSVNGGSTYAQTAGDYNYTLESTRPGTSDVLSSSNPSSVAILLGPSSDIGNTLISVNGRASLFVGDGTRQAWLNISASQVEETFTAPTMYRAVGLRGSSTAINAFRVLMDTGNIQIGNFRLYGVR